jgi:hypothetical protein
MTGKKLMKVGDLVATLKECDQNAQILASSDEELNTLFREIEIGELEHEEGKARRYVLYGLSGTEEEEEKTEGEKNE